MTNKSAVAQCITSPRLNVERLLERFVSYVQVDSAANPNSSCYPSSEGQRELGAILCQELSAMGIEDAHQDENGLVWATVPATVPGETPTVCLCSHVDTSPEAPASGVKPQVVRYDGGDIALASGDIITESEIPRELKGTRLITTDGSTLLGGDDKAGVAIIMEVAETLMERPDLQRGPVRVLLTCDEEIGHGTDKIDLKKVDAAVAYTIDGGDHGVIDVETFSADGATVTFSGYNIHPAIGKDKMINAVRAAAELVARLPKDHQSPETTDGRDGFIHPYAIEGGVAEASVKMILRSFESSDLNAYADQIRSIVAAILDETPGLSADVQITRQYRNLHEGLQSLPESVEFAERAFDQLGIACKKEIIRGGTDGSQLTEKGLPTPNLSSGQHNIHSIKEYACLDEMVIAGEHLIELLDLWAGQSR
ncbi:MAG: peptidase T [Planctomycetota bacterium]